MSPVAEMAAVSSRYIVQESWPVDSPLMQPVWNETFVKWKCNCQM